MATPVWVYASLGYRYGAPGRCTCISVTGVLQLHVAVFESKYQCERVLCRQSRESSIGMGERVVNFLSNSHVVNDGGLRTRPQDPGRFPPRILEILLVALFALGGYPQAKSETQLRSQASRLAAPHAEARCDSTTTACGLPRPGRGALSEATLPSDTFPLRRVGSRASSDGGDAGPIRVLNRLAPCSKWEEEPPGGGAGRASLRR